MKIIHLLTIIFLQLIIGTQAEAKIIRSERAVSAFKHSHPCPANGATRGPCYGYIIDHIKPLACGGADQPSNMQWQTVPEAKAKDKWERKDCRIWL